MDKLTPLSVHGLSLQSMLERASRDMVGYDRLFRVFQDTGTVMNAHSYPPYNIEMLDEEHYRISIAVAGFNRDELVITVEDRILSIEGAKNDKEEDNTTSWLYRGIASRSFKRQFMLADMVEVSEADLADGMLIINLDLIIPEEKKPRQIAINIPKKRK